jgi:hypothetical protein
MAAAKVAGLELVLKDFVLLERSCDALLCDGLGRKERFTGPIDF